MSEKSKNYLLWSLNIGLVTLIISIIIATAVYFEGFKVRKEINDRLILTNCTIYRTEIAEVNCTNGCASSRKFITCEQTCYKWQILAFYQTKEQDMDNDMIIDVNIRHDFIKESGEVESLKIAESILRDSTINLQYECYYDSDDYDNVLTKKYNLKSWLIWVYFSIACQGICLIVCSISGLIYFYKFILYEGVNNVIPKQYRRSSRGRNHHKLSKL